jgi:hypothetical protein
MAETAGTIGIPNIKNEILPYLENYSRRQERAAELEATRQRRQQELLYKQEQEAGKLTIPDIPSPKEGYWSPYIAKKRNAFVDNLVAAQASGKVSQGEINTLSRAGRSQIENEDVNQAWNSKLLEDRAKELQEQGVTGANKGLIQTYVNQGMSSADPDGFFTSPHLQGFEAFATGDYRNISPAKIMDNTLKGKKPSSKKIEVGGKTEDFEYYDIFDLGREKDPTTGADVIAAKSVNIPKAEMYVNADPVRQKLKDNWIASKAKVLELDPQYSGLPDADRKVKAQEAAVKQFYDEAGRGYQAMKFGVGYDEARAAGGGSKNAYAKYTAGVEKRRLSNNATVPVYGFAAPTGTAFEIDIPQNATYLNTNTNKTEKLTDAGIKLLSPGIGYAARKKGTKDEYIDPADYGKIRASEVDFVPGIYGTKSTLQTKTAAGGIGGNTGGFSMASTGMGGPFTTGDQIFIEEGLPGFETKASEILRAKGSSYKAAKAKALKETMGKFLQKKFRTKV